ncbi:hypothetical protein AHAS_Ahas15G0071900 [Arachis hypogaea]
MGKPNKIHKVLYDPNEEKIECECSMWNSEGIPCSHILCVMKYEGLEEIPKGLILSRCCKDAKDWSSKPPPQVTDGPQGRLLRYGALSGLMNLVARLGSEDPAEFVVAREGIASLVEDLQRRAYRRVGSQLGLSMPPALKDPPVSKTKGAPRKGKEVEPEPGSKCEIPTKRRRCTSCGVHGHTKKTCTWHRAHRGPDTEGGAVPGCAECSSGMGSAPSATLRDKSAGRFQCCSGHRGESHGNDVSRMSNPTRHTNEELLEHWLSQDRAFVVDVNRMPWAGHRAAEGMVAHRSKHKLLVRRNRDVVGPFLRIP